MPENAVKSLEGLVRCDVKKKGAKGERRLESEVKGVLFFLVCLYILFLILLLFKVLHKPPPPPQ